MKRYVLCLLAFIGIGCAGGYLYFMNYSPDRSTYPVRGIDVSNHQGAIAWKRVASDDVSFAIIKATEGGDWVDKSFARNLAEARQAGLAVGAYHFFTFCRSGAEQAQNFISTVPHDEALLPPVIDIEFYGNCAERPAAAQFKTELNAFVDAVETHFGKPAIIYLIDEAENLYGEVMPDRPRWVRSLSSHPGDENWLYWQYHHMGRVDGIEGDVDLNVLQGGPSTLAELTRRPAGL